MPQRFRIQSISSYSDYITFGLDSYVVFSNGNYSTINCVNRFPFNRYGYYDEVEIDTDGIRNKYNYEYLNNVLLVKKVPSGRNSLYNLYSEGKISSSERQEILRLTDIDYSPVFTVEELRKIYYFDYLAKNNRSKLGIGEKIHRVILFSTWFNPNCALIVNGDSAPLSLTLTLYEPAWQNIPEILEIVRFSEGYSNEADIKNKLCDIEAKLNGKHPVLYAPLEHSYDNGYRFNNVKEIVIPLSDDFKNNPDNYIKPLSVIKNWTGSGRLGHGAVYLGNKKICHESGSNAILIVDWSPNTETCYYYPFIPFKTKEKIIEHLAKAVEGSVNYYARWGLLNSETNNCEHFCNKSVYGVNMSEQVEMAKHRRNMIGKIKRIDNLEAELRENDTIFSGLASDIQVTGRIREINSLVARNTGYQSGDVRNIVLETYIEITPKSDYRMN